MWEVGGFHFLLNFWSTVWYLTEIGWVHWCRTNALLLLLCLLSISSSSPCGEARGRGRKQVEWKWRANIRHVYFCSRDDSNTESSKNHPGRSWIRNVCLEGQKREVAGYISLLKACQKWILLSLIFYVYCIITRISSYPSFKNKSPTAFSTTHSPNSFHWYETLLTRW